MNNLIKQIVENKFNFNINIEDNGRQNLLSKSKYNSISQKQLYLDQYIVDLGLPSKTIWCKYNLGVDIYKLSKPKDWHGDYYAWGELKPKDQYTWDNYKFCKVSRIKKYNNANKLKQLQLEDDAAYQNLNIGNLKFRIPSKEQFKELLEYTTHEWIENYQNAPGLNGMIFKNKTSNNEMFIPTAGYYNESGLNDVGVIATIWSSNLNTDCIDYAWYFFFDPGRPGMSYYDRCIGMPIRPVLYIN